MPVDAAPIAWVSTAAGLAVGAGPSGRKAARKVTARRQPSPVARRATISRLHGLARLPVLLWERAMPAIAVPPLVLFGENL